MSCIPLFTSSASYPTMNHDKPVRTSRLQAVTTTRSTWGYLFGRREAKTAGEVGDAQLVTDMFIPVPSNPSPVRASACDCLSFTVRRKRQGHKGPQRERASLLPHGQDTTKIDGPCDQLARAGWPWEMAARRLGPS
ncbi:hypothetical protein G7046_g606 [Stylonectria norvegica]|nr:hypothetical protein G7046_g606 [Stylonectria norvegica]